jgi:hypothetical protein
MGRDFKVYDGVVTPYESNQIDFPMRVSRWNPVLNSRVGEDFRSFESKDELDEIILDLAKELVSLKVDKEKDTNDEEELVREIEGSKIVRTDEGKHGALTIEERKKEMIENELEYFRFLCKKEEEEKESQKKYIR